MRNNLLIALSIMAYVLSPSAFAEVKINGFASVVMGIDLDDDDQSNYGNRTVDNLQDSKVALQWTADLEKGMRFVGQTMARGTAADGFLMTYDWAYFDFNVGDSGKVKFGRLRIPFYKYSDYLDVGYAYHWITPPLSMYSLTFSNMDGVGYQQNFESAGMEHSLNVAFGAYQGILTLGTEEVDSTLENLIAINWSATMGNHEFSAAFARADTYVPAASTVQLSGLTDKPNDLLINGDNGQFIGIGYKGSFGDFTVFSEYSIVSIDKSVFADSAGGYLGVSYGMNDYTYHVTYGTRKAEEKTFTGPVADSDIGLVTTGGAGPASVSSLNSTVRSIGNGDSTTITLGARKDIGSSTALKVDLDLYTEDRIQTDQISAVSEEKKATTLRFAIETMF